MKESTLVLMDGSKFTGFSFGAEKSMSGEVVFSTGMVGYPEAFTDPSYRGQILVLTFPLIGNYGVPSDRREHDLPKHFESDDIQIRGLIVSDYSDKYSHWDAQKSLGQWLSDAGVPALFGIDTRALTKQLREKGTMLGSILIDSGPIALYDPNIVDLVKEATVERPIIYRSGAAGKRVVLIDCGAKHNIVRSLVARGLCVIRVPYDYDFFSLEFDGILISNGPGDPKMCTTTIDHVRRALEKNIPTFGICLGNQILALAAGGNTYKLKYGHRSQNQPCALTSTQRCFITTQNHGFAVDMKSLHSDWEEFFVNVNDGTNEGIRHKTKPFFSVQFHPESTPGPTDTDHLFDEFVKML